MKARRFFPALYWDNHLQRAQLIGGHVADEDRLDARLHTENLIVHEPRYAALCQACGTSDFTHFPSFRSKLVERRQS
jgi:hypothetical protein